MHNKMVFFLVAGEESGDLHGAKLIEALRDEFPHSEFIGHGGEKMRRQGMVILEHISTLSMMGFTEVLRHLPYMMRVMNNTLNKIKVVNPNRIILIDYPGFNLRLAKKVAKLNIPITYFILPQVWAWKEKRINIIKDHTDQRLSIFPFEKPWFSERDIDVDFIGHPFSMLKPANITKDEFFAKHNLNPNNPLLVLLPGSRQQEIGRHWKVFLKTAQRLKNSYPFLQIIVGKAEGITLNPLPEYIRTETNSRLALQFGTAALASSGTVTLEAAVLDCPVVVTYKLSTMTWQIAKRIVRVKYASIVNLIADKEVVPEFLQEDMTPDNLFNTLTSLMSDTPKRRKTLTDFLAIRSRLGEKDVYQHAAKLIRKKSLS
ncbi:MAG: lipid-A-disaccharide synthase [Candidatus Marinimicrobia bacterium]|nr:lipid-A-disaccharide synthase [Candidatus Neomarinimicrobiota bacterium]